MSNDNVLQFPKKPAIFTPKLREEIKTRIAPHSEADQVDQIVDRTEDAICFWAVVGIRSLAEKLADVVGEAITGEADRAFTKLEGSNGRK